MLMQCSGGELGPLLLDQQGANVEVNELLARVHQSQSQHRVAGVDQIRASLFHHRHKLSIAHQLLEPQAVLHAPVAVLWANTCDTHHSSLSHYEPFQQWVYIEGKLLRGFHAPDNLALIAWYGSLQNLAARGRSWSTDSTV